MYEKPGQSKVTQYAYTPNILMGRLLWWSKFNICCTVYFYSIVADWLDLPTLYYMLDAYCVKIIPVTQIWQPMPFY